MFVFKSETNKDNFNKPSKIWADEMPKCVSLSLSRIGAWILRKSGLLRSHSRLESGFFENNYLKRYLKIFTNLILKAEVVQLLLQIVRVLVLALLQKHGQFVVANHVVVVSIVARVINRIGLIALGHLGAECLAIDANDSEIFFVIFSKKSKKFSNLVLASKMRSFRSSSFFCRLAMAAASFFSRGKSSLYMAPFCVVTKSPF